MSNHCQKKRLLKYIFRLYIGQENEQNTYFYTIADGYSDRLSKFDLRANPYVGVIVENYFVSYIFLKSIYHRLISLRDIVFYAVRNVMCRIITALGRK